MNHLLARTDKFHTARLWCSHKTSKPAVDKTCGDIRKAGYTIEYKWIYWGDLYVGVKYEPGLKYPWPLPLRRRYYQHKNKRYELPMPDIYFTSKSIKKYFTSRIPEEHLRLDFNPGAPIYDKPLFEIVPVSQVDTR